MNGIKKKALRSIEKIIENNEEVKFSPVFKMVFGKNKNPEKTIGIEIIKGEKL